VNDFDYILNNAISLFIIIPLVAFIASLFWKNHHEKPIAFIVQFTKGFFIAATVAYAVLWFMNGSEPVNQKLFTIYQTDRFVFAIQFYYDLVTVVFSIV
jgi:hypothetical protein